MLKVAVIANRASGSGHRLHELSVPTQAWFAPESVDWDACLDAELIVLVGGDGTLQRTITALLNLPALDAARIPPLAVVPFGTTNMSAANINRSRSRRQALASLQATLFRTPAELVTARHPLLELRGPTGSRFGYAFGLGAITSAVRDWRRGRGDATVANQLRSLLVLGRALRGADAGVAVDLGGSQFEAYALVLTTLARLLYGITPFWGSAAAADAAIRGTWVKAGTPGLLRLAPAILRGAPRLAGVAGVGSHAFEKVDLTFDAPYILDGEIYEAEGGTLTVSSCDGLRWLAL